MTKEVYASDGNTANAPGSDATARLAMVPRWMPETICDIADHYSGQETLTWRELREIQTPRTLIRSLGPPVKRPQGVPLTEVLWRAVEQLHIEAEVDERLRGRSDQHSLCRAVAAAIRATWADDDASDSVELRRIEQELNSRWPFGLAS